MCNNDQNRGLNARQIDMSRMCEGSDFSPESTGDYRWELESSNEKEEHDAPFSLLKDNARLAFPSSMGPHSFLPLQKTRSGPRCFIALHPLSATSGKKIKEQKEKSEEARGLPQLLRFPAKEKPFLSNRILHQSSSDGDPEPNRTVVPISTLAVSLTV